MAIVEDRRVTFSDFPFKDFNRSQKIAEGVCDMIHQNDDSIWIFGDERAALYELAAGYHNKPETEGYIVDFGTHRGASACIMGTALRDTKSAYQPLFTVDPYSFSDFGTQSYLEARESFRRVRGMRVFICAMIYEDLRFLEFWNLPTRLIFIDTSHQYDHTKLEIEKSIPHVMDDGWLLLHDYGDEPWNGDVKRAVNEFLDNQTEYDLEVFFVPDCLVCLHVKGRRGRSQSR